MTSISVTHTLADLERDMIRVARKARSDMAEVVRLNTARGMGLARDSARKHSGPHGRLYFKRISMDMNGPLEGVYGPTGDVEGNAVGAGYRNGNDNLDLKRSADVIGPRFAREVHDLPDKWFW